jgi:hypothetical protein
MMIRARNDIVGKWIVTDRTTVGQIFAELWNSWRRPRREDGKMHTIRLYDELCMKPYSIQRRKVGVAYCGSVKFDLWNLLKLAFEAIHVDDHQYEKA